ncbi:hypothetical protein EV401DRAFT_1892868 [Pisolithus croceorrhizus]|nr:hypothetical protein EV401DRAFT_1892868 [Pisolithus croceorrhizus]
MSEEQQWRVCFYHSRPYPVSPADEATSSSENRSEATHCPSMEASTSVDRSWTLQPVNIPIPPVRGSIDQMAAMHNAVIPTPPGSATAPSMDRIEVMCSATIPTPPASAPKPCMDQMSQAPNTDWLERMHNAMIPQVPLARIEMMDEQLQPPALTGGNVDHPHQSTSIEVADGQTQPSMITEGDISQGEEPDHGPTVDFGNQNHRQLQALFLNVVAGDVPTPDEHQALEQAGLAMSDADDDFLHTLQTFKSQHGADFPPMHFPYNKQLDGHIVQVMRQLAANIQHLISSQVQNVQAGQYTVDMIDLLEVSHHPHVGYSLQPYTGGWYANLCLDMKELEHLILCQEDQAQFQAEVQQIPLSAFWMINEISLFIPNWMPRSPNKYVGFVFPWWVDGSLQYTADFEQMRGTRIFPIAHKYFQHTWPLQQLSMGDRIDEWMEEKWFALSRLLSLQDA